MKATRLGIFSAFTASLCCAGPAVLIALGLGGLGGSAFFGRFAVVLVGIAMVLLGLGWWLYAKEVRQCRAAQCQMPGRTATLATLAVASVIVAGFALIHLGSLVNKAACALSCPR